MFNCTFVQGVIFKGLFLFNEIQFFSLINKPQNLENFSYLKQNIEKKFREDAF